MQQEASDEFVGRDCHGPFADRRGDNPSSGNARAILDIDEAVVGDGDAVRISTNVIQDLFGSGEGRLGVDHPVGLSQRRQIAPEGVALVEVLQGGEELQLARLEGLLQMLQEQAAEQA